MASSSSSSSSVVAPSLALPPILKTEKGKPLEGIVMKRSADAEPFMYTNFRMLFHDATDIAGCLSTGQHASKTISTAIIGRERMVVESEVKKWAQNMKIENEKAIAAAVGASQKTDNDAFVRATMLLSQTLSKKEAEVAALAAENQTLREKETKKQEAADALNGEKQSWQTKLDEKQRELDALAGKMKDALAEKDAEHTAALTQLAAEKEKEKEIELAAAIRVATMTMSQLQAIFEKKESEPSSQTLQKEKEQHKEKEEKEKKQQTLPLLASQEELDKWR